MNIDHFIRVFDKDKNNDDLLSYIIDGFFTALQSGGKIKKLNKEELINLISEDKKEKWN